MGGSYNVRYLLPLRPGEPGHMGRRVVPLIPHPTGIVRSREPVQISEAFENGVGTYLKVVRFSEPTNPDGFVVLYLRPNGRFLFAGYWSGYERSLAAGGWVRQGVEVRLDGRGLVATDAIPGPEGGRFERVFTVEDANHTPPL